jgi:hypothetical protein
MAATGGNPSLIGAGGADTEAQLAEIKAKVEAARAARQKALAAPKEPALPAPSDDKKPDDDKPK